LNPRQPATERDTPLVISVVLSWNGVHDTLACLESLGDSKWTNHEVIVVDNGSTDGTSDAVSKRFPDVEIIRSDRNLGFAGGNNLGIRRALAMNAEYVFVLNNDTMVPSGCLPRLVTTAEQLRDLGALCPLLTFANPRDLIWYAGASFDPAKGRSGRMLGYRATDTGQYAGIYETDRAVGAAMLVPADVLRRVGLLNEALFLQYEDVDWSLRMRAAGLRIYVNADARVEHKVSVASGGEYSPTVAYYEMRNHLAVCEQHAPMRGIPRLRRRAVALGVSLARLRHADHRLVCAREIAVGFVHGTKGRLGPRSSSQPQTDG
jgi:GT2 family glycosyltransferase